MRVLRELRRNLEQPQGSSFAPEENVHPADLADVLWLDFEPEEARLLFARMTDELAAEVLAEAEPQLQQQLLEAGQTERLGRLLNEMSADDGADVLEILPDSDRQAVLRKVEPEQARDLQRLGAYDGETAGGMMTTEFVPASREENVGDVIKRLKRDDGEFETINTIYVLDPRDVLVGVMSARELLDAGIHSKVGEIMNPDVIKAGVDEDQEEVARRLLHYNLTTIPVVRTDGALAGIVTADDALEVLEEEASEDAYLLAGASSNTLTSEPVRVKVLHRAPMLVVTVLGGLLMSRVMAIFTGEEDPAKDAFGIFLPYIPMVLALCGTVGQQTSAVAVRGFAIGQLDPGRRMPFFLGEVQVGAALGLLSSLIAAPAAALFSQEITVGLSLGIALLLAMTWTTTTACSIAMGSQAAGFDPAVVSGPVMMTVSDLSAVVLFFTTASFFASSG